MEISSINNSSINLNTATRAFEANEKQTAKKEPKEDFKQEDIALMEQTRAKTVDVADIQKYAGLMGETLSIDDINYGLMYGRSVIADYSA